MSDNLLTLTDDGFDNDVLQAGIPILVDFWAEWCGPCRMITPILEEIASDPNYADKIKIGKLNVDDNPATAGKYGVRGIPTLMIFKGGDATATKVGALSKPQLTAFIDETLSE